MSYLIDTDWVVAALKGRADAQTLLTSLSEEGLAVSLITYGEIYEGIYHGADPLRHEQVFLAFLRDVDILPLNESIMQEFARVRGELRAQGNLIGDFDLLIAATAIHHDLTLVTRNTAHFQRVPNLSLYQFVR
ncbi:MAG TPA: type II toxin-antitoxin system VapC family toxin [Chloroflexia bacterium]|jgi:predicted nucleic acid-binding protein